MAKNEIPRNKIGSIKHLEAWFVNQCDSKWEHEFGIKIESLDNPGWWIEIDLVGTNLQDRQFFNQEVHRSENDWYECRVQNKKFIGTGDPTKLHVLLQEFYEWERNEKGETSL
jgi:Immunity protein 53